MEKKWLFSEDMTDFKLSAENISGLGWVAEQIPGGFFIYLAEGDGELIYANGAMCDIFGCDTMDEFREHIGNTFRGIVHPDDYESVQNSIDDQIAEKDNRRQNDYVIYRIIKKDGEVRWVEDFGHYAEFPGYGPVYYVFISDITQSKLAQEEKERADVLEHALRHFEEANNAKISFLSNMSHEIRTPITAILGMNELIERETDDLGILEYAENIRKAGVSLLGIINDILDFSKIETGRMDFVDEEYSLKSMIGDLYNLVRFRTESKGLELGFIIDKNIPEKLIGDEIRIKQIITNLLTNAVKYTESGSVVFELKMIDKTSDTMNLEVSVRDTGIGIKKEEMDRLFEPFDRLDLKKTRTIEGTGLGLAITRKMLAQMGSELNVESVYGSGSTFFFTLTQKIADDKPIGAISMDDLIHNNPQIIKNKTIFTAPGMSILIVDDTPMNLQVVAGLLKRTRVHIDTATSGRECLEKLDTNHYDMIFLDYRMPQMNGIETLLEIKKMYPDLYEKTPIISLTASVLSGDKEKMLESGFTDYLSKPVNSDELESVMIKHLPADSIVMIGVDGSTDNDSDSDLPDAISQYPQLDAKKGIEYCGDVEDYIFALETYEKSIEDKAAGLENDLKSKDMENFTMNMHSLKSTSGAIGAVGLFEKAKELEAAGKENNIEKLEKETPLLLKEYREMRPILKRIISEYDTPDEAVETPEPVAVNEDNNDTPHKSISLEGKKILLAEDMNINAQILKQLLSMRGIETDIVSDGLEAVAGFKAVPEGTYDAVLMDIRMPNLDGLKATEQIRALDRKDAKDVPIIALTGNTFEEDVEESLGVGMNAHLSKPVEPNSLFATLEELIK